MTRPSDSGTSGALTRAEVVSLSQEAWATFASRAELALSLSDMEQGDVEVEKALRWQKLALALEGQAHRLYMEECGAVDGWRRV